MRPLISLLLISLLPACVEDDADNDGLLAEVDCDDSDPLVGDQTAWYADADGDRHGDPERVRAACDRPEGFVNQPDDCDDESAQINPEIAEVCNARDDDCDGLVDDGVVSGTRYADSDGDGFGDPGAPSQSCVAEPGTAANAADCDDTNAAIHPGADEVCNGADDDCTDAIDDAATDFLTFYEDLDGDGFGDSLGVGSACSVPPGFALVDGDCDDGDAAKNPGTPEVCDGEDQDCDGTIDDGATDLRAWYRDDDRDGFGDPALSFQACEAPQGFVGVSGDCADGDATLNPETPWYADIDGDGFGDSSDVLQACDAPSGRVRQALDCDDGKSAVHPGVPEVCDDLDNDCDGYTDNEAAIDATIWYADLDGDGHGDAGTWGVACEAPEGFLASGGDCDDDDPDRFPSAPEVCDDTDNDCDGLTDDDDPKLVGVPTWYRDQDEDSFGDPARTRQTCDLPEGYVHRARDCDDRRDDVNPAAEEVCDGDTDEDCDGKIDRDDPNMAGDETWYADKDDDGFGDLADTRTGCARPDGYTSNTHDCDDTRAEVNPDATEVCGNGLDDDCASADGHCQWGSGLANDLADAWWRGESDGIGLGGAFAALPDATGDGLPEIVVSASQYGTYGAVYVLGSDPRPSASGERLTQADTIATIGGETYGDRFGAAMAVGDLTGDGIADLAVGAPEYYGTNYSQGVAYVIPGDLLQTPGAVLSASSGFRLRGQGYAEYAGESLAIGDLDGDGVADLAVGAPGTTNGSAWYAGAVYVLRGPISQGGTLAASSQSTIVNSGTYDYMGDFVETGDFDGDGRADLAIGYPEEGGAQRGAAVIFTEIPSGTVNATDADFKITGTDYSYTGSLDLGDADGDGVDDLLLGAYQTADAFLVFGPRSGSMTTAEADVRLSGASGSGAGLDVSFAGDVNGDGEQDVAIGAPYHDGQIGSAYVSYGPFTEPTVDIQATSVVFTGAPGSVYFGETIEGMGDLDQDGYDDLMIGSPLFDPPWWGWYGRGSAHLFFGRGI